MKALYRNSIHLIAGAVLFTLPVLVANLPAGSPFSGGQAMAEEEPPQKTRKTPAMREKVYKKLSEAQVEAEAGNMQSALSILAEVQRMKDLNSYEIAQMYNFYGFIYFSQENYKEAVKAYQNLLAQPDLPEAMETATQYSLAQLYFTTDDYPNVVKTLNAWFRNAVNPGPEPYLLLGQAYYQMKEYEKAITPIETAMDLARAKNQEIKENWWLLLRVFYYELGNYQKVKEILVELLKKWPKRDYWIQLSGMYGELGEDRKQLIAYEMAYLQGFLTRGREHITLAQLMMQANVPYRAATILEEGMNKGIIEKNAENYRLLSQAWSMAQEDLKAIEPLTQAARLSGDGELDIRLAQSYFNLYRYEEAAEAARSALNKGGLKRRDNANILLGMALYNIKRYEEAKSAFNAARGDSRSASIADQWLTHIGNEQDRERQLRAALGS